MLRRPINESNAPLNVREALQRLQAKYPGTKMKTPTSTFDEREKIYKSVDATFLPRGGRAIFGSEIVQN